MDVDVDVEGGQSGVELDGGARFAGESKDDSEGMKNGMAMGDLMESGSGSGSRAQYYAGLPADCIPEPRGRFPARRITWRIRSHDQGWGGIGGDTYENSQTGFRGNVLRIRPVERKKREASGNGGEDLRLRGSKEYLSAWKLLAEEGSETRADGGIYEEGDDDEECIWPRGEWDFGPTRIQVNARAERGAREHVIVWDFRDSIDIFDPKAVEMLVKKGRGILTGAGNQVRALQTGDVVELHSYAFFPFWQNFVENAEVRVEFAL